MTRPVAASTTASASFSLMLVMLSTLTWGTRLGADYRGGQGRRSSQHSLSSSSGRPPPAGATSQQMMAHRLCTAEANVLYKRRGAIVESAIANLKKILDRFSRRGLQQASGELPTPQPQPTI